MNQKAMHFQAVGALRKPLLGLSDFPSSRLNNSSNNRFDLLRKIALAGKNCIISVAGETETMLLCDSNQFGVCRTKDQVRENGTCR